MKAVEYKGINYTNDKILTKAILHELQARNAMLQLYWHSASNNLVEFKNATASTEEIIITEKKINELNSLEIMIKLQKNNFMDRYVKMKEQTYRVLDFYQSTGNVRELSKKLQKIHSKELQYNTMLMIYRKMQNLLSDGKVFDYVMRMPQYKEMAIECFRMTRKMTKMDSDFTSNLIDSICQKNQTKIDIQQKNA